MTLAPGRRLGRYEITSLLGAGGMGEVYRARDTRIERDVAVKVLSPSLALDDEGMRRFELEAKAAGALNHPNILAVYDAGAEDGAPYVVYELLDGDTLRERLAGGALPLRKAIEVAIQVAQGLAAAHEKGIVHRDLKPENIFVTRDGLAKILDFGLAKLVRSEPIHSAPTEVRASAQTKPGVILGTVGYMSPEQVAGQPVDARTDIFSLGAVLYETLTGERAFVGDSAIAVLSAILKDEPRDLAAAKPDLPLPLQSVVRHCLEKRPDERFQSARDIAFALKELSVPSGTAPRMAPIRPSRLPFPVRLGAVVAAALAVAAGGFFLGQRTAGRAAVAFKQLTFGRGGIGSARFAPDGQTVYYSAAWADQPPDVFATVAGSPESRALKVGPARMAGATRGELALILIRGFSGGGTLARMPLGSGAPRELLEGVMEADLAPDGERFAVARVVNGRARLEYPIGTVLFETPSYFGNPRISPRGDLVAFINHPVQSDSRGYVAVVDPKGTVRKLSAEWNEAFGLAWAPGGDEIWFTAASVGSAQGLWAVTLGGKQRLLARVAGRLQLLDVSGDGRALVSHSIQRWELLGLPPGASRERDFTWLDHSVAVDLSADGNWLLFGESGDGGGEKYSVYLRRTDGSPPVRLGDGQATSLSPDGKWALSVLHGAEPQLGALPTGPGEARTLRRGVVAAYHWAWWLPDGRQVLIQGNQAGKKRQLFLQGFPDGEPRPVTPEGTTAPQTNTITPDGREVIATCPDDEDRFCIWGIGTGRSRPIAGLQPGEDPLRWSADGRSLYIRERGSRLPVHVALLDVATGERRPWCEVGPTDPVGVHGLREILLTPDGKVRFYFYERGLSELYEVSSLR